MRKKPLLLFSTKQLHLSRCRDTSSQKVVAKVLEKDSKVVQDSEEEKVAEKAKERLQMALASDLKRTRCHLKKERRSWLNLKQRLDVLIATKKVTGPETMLAS